MPSINFKTKLLTFGVFFFHSIIHGVQLTVLLLPVTAGDDFKGTIHINCGSSSDYTDPVTNKTWIADNYFKGGRKYQNDSLVKVYANRRTRNLYSSCRSGTDFSYSIPVYPDRKIQYNVKLYFYEIV